MLFNQPSNPAAPTANDAITISLKTLVNLAQAASQLTLRHSAIRTRQNGGYASPFKGRGMEFDETRLYQPGDDIRSIDWKVTARTGKAHTKLFREERERPVFISVDYRQSMRFATRGVFKSVQAAKIAGLIAWTAQHHGDRIGGQLFTEQTCLELKPQNGKHAVLRFFNQLVQPSFAEPGAFSLEHILARLNQHAHPGSLIYLISDFRGLNQAAERHLSRLSRHADVVLVLIYDPLESQLPTEGRYRLTDSQRDIVIDTHNRQRLLNYHQRFLQHCEHLEKLAQQWRMTFLRCRTDESPEQSLR